MRVFRRTALGMILGIIAAPFSAFTVFFVGSVFTDNEMILIGASAGIFIAVIYMSVFGENITLELDGSTLRYYRRKNLKHEFDAANCSFRYKIVSGSGIFSSSDIKLYVTDMNSEMKKETQLDCSPIGQRRFHELFELLEELSRHEIPVIRTIKK